MSRYTFHFSPAQYFDSLNPEEDYLPPHYAQDGFIHCTDGSANLARTGNRFYKDDPRDFYVLYLDKERIKSPVVYEDPNNIYPHIYGPLNRDAIVDIKPALRAPDGTFLQMPEYTPDP
jgi:uncharacterized protein (DUF952 family)